MTQHLNFDRKMTPLFAILRVYGLQQLISTAFTEYSSYQWFSFKVNVAVLIKS